MPKLSDRLQYIRARYNLSQVDLAQKAGTTQQAIQQAEKGKARQPRYLHKLAHALEIPIDWMIFGEIESHQNMAVSQNAGLHEKEEDVLNQFFSMPKQDQKLIYDLMKSRQKSDEPESK